MCDLIEGAEIIRKRDHNAQIAAGKQRYEYEYTDTYGGEANYSWVNRGHVYARSQLAAVTVIKAIVGLTGLKCSREDQGEVLALRPYRMCTILFIQPGGGP